ncbi:MAG: hypothetical protein J3K34DRAFT_522366 [Monoraphidium minutum]|nr:MAG: hypothetical protein J3K34DRAFT_522366 [Monoraphidium minutum]
MVRLTALGFRYAGGLSVELEFATTVEYAVHPDGCGADTTTADIPRDWAGVFAGVRVNGKAAAARVGSGDTLRFGGASVHFPAARHEGDASDGLMLVVTLYLESEDITHLDFAVTIDNGASLPPMHGLLGQSLAWAAGAPAAIEGSELEYAVEGGLLGTAFKYSKSSEALPAAAPRTKGTRRSQLGLGDATPLSGGSVAYDAL